MRVIPTRLLFCTCSVGFLLGRVKAACPAPAGALHLHPHLKKNRRYQRLFGRSWAAQLSVSKPARGVRAKATPLTTALRWPSPRLGAIDRRKDGCHRIRPAKSPQHWTSSLPAICCRCRYGLSVFLWGVAAGQTTNTHISKLGGCKKPMHEAWAVVKSGGCWLACSREDPCEIPATTPTEW